MFCNMVFSSGAHQLVFVVLLTFISATHAAILRAACTIAINGGGLPDPQPLILKNGGSNDGFGFHLPDSKGIVTVASNSAVRLACTGSGNTITALGTNVQDVQATCVGGTSWTVSGKSFTFRELYCKSNPVHEARRTSGTCYNGNSLIDVGFQVGTSFKKIMDICFDDKNLDAVWSKYDLVKGIGGEQVGFPRPDFVASTFYPGLSPDNQYGRVTQRDTIAVLLGSKAQADKYISQTTDYFLSRGHLTAKTDYVYGSQHRATFYFINVAPQWQTFNGGNWNTLEDNVRAMASSRGLDLEVYTGTHGIATLPNTSGKETNLYLYKDKNNNLQISVPALFWKVVYNPVTKQGVALIGVNNPYIAFADLGENILCTDVCSQITWVKWSPSDQKKGFGYCCDVNQFRTKVPSVPSFTVTGLLK